MVLLHSTSIPSGPALGCRAARAASVLDHHLRRLVGDHDGGRVGVARGDAGHHRGVDHAQSLEADDAQPFVDHRQRIGRAGPSLPCRPGGRSWCRYRRRPWPARHRRRRRRAPGRIFLRPEACSARWRHQAPGHADGVGGDAAVFLGVEIVGLDHRLVATDRPSGGGCVPREVGRRLQALTVIGREAVQGIAELVERQRLDMELDVGALVRRARSV